MSKVVDFKKISHHETPEESIGYLLWRVSTHWRSSIEKKLRELDLTHPQFVVLAVLGWLTQKGDKVSQAEIGRTAGLDPNTASQILRGLEAKKLIQRNRLSDERAKNPILTDFGRAILVKALPAVEKADEKFFSKLSQNEINLLVKFFQKLMV